MDNSSPISEAFEPFLHFDAAKECKSTYFAKDSALIFLQIDKSIAELPATKPVKRSPNPALAVSESVPHQNRARERLRSMELRAF